jgi:hypothetical protein
VPVRALTEEKKRESTGVPNQTDISSLFFGSFSLSLLSSFFFSFFFFFF